MPVHNIVSVGAVSMTEGVVGVHRTTSVRLEVRMPPKPAHVAIGNSIIVQEIVVQHIRHVDLV